MFCGCSHCFCLAVDRYHLYFRGLSSGPWTFYILLYIPAERLPIKVETHLQSGHSILTLFLYASARLAAVLQTIDMLGFVSCTQSLFIFVESGSDPSKIPRRHAVLYVLYMLPGSRELSGEYQAPLTPISIVIIFPMRK